MTNTETIDLLKKLISTKSLSKEEDKTADIIEAFLTSKNIAVKRIGNNIIAHTHAETKKPIILLNSHHDTVRVSEGWTKDPFAAEEVDGTLYGLGSNDAGASLVSLINCFIHYSEQDDLPYQLYLIASAEEEISGKGGLERALAELSLEPDVAIVGEPTQCQMAVAEKGLIVIDGVAKGIAGHAANQVGDNAIYHALKDIQWMESYTFARQSEWLNQVKVTVTQIEAGYQHNVVPDICQFVVDCRINDQYSFEDFLEILKANCTSTLTPRSLRLTPSSIDIDHPLVKKGKVMGLKAYGSNTLSDQVFLSCPSLKIGPGDSHRSHKADEYIHIKEIEQGIETYKELLNGLML